MSLRHHALLLAAGGSHRLGQPKQLLRKTGRPLVRWLAECALACQPERVFVVAGACAASVKAALAGLSGDEEGRLDVLDNPLWPSGLASSLQRAAPLLARAGLPVLVLGCDQPRLEPGRLAELLALAARAPDRVTVCDYGAAMGLPALVPAALFAEAGKLNADQGLKRLWQTRPVQVLAAPELAFDIDTPADLAQARQNGWLDPAE